MSASSKSSPAREAESVRQTKACFVCGSDEAGLTAIQCWVCAALLRAALVSSARDIAAATLDAQIVVDMHVNAARAGGYL